MQGAIAFDIWEKPRESLHRPVYAGSCRLFVPTDPLFPGTALLSRITMHGEFVPTKEAFTTGPNR